MKVCIYGAGAIGGYLAVELKRAGVDVTCIARGDHLRAIQKNGLKLLIGGEEHIEKMPCTDDPNDLGPQDYVIVAVKAPSAHSVAQRMTPLLGRDTAVVTAQNGIPWWYFYRHGGPYDGRRIASVDPGNSQWKFIGPERAIGCVVYPAAEIVEPGVIKHIYSNRFSIGEPDRSKSTRLLILSDMLSNAGFKARVRTNIRDEIWLKLWGNLSFNPVSALTGGTIRQIIEDPGALTIIRAMMLEAKLIAESLGVTFKIDLDKRIAGALEVGDHKTSMLQDLEKGRIMEVDALLGVVQELGRLNKIQTPTIDTVLALVKLEGKLAGAYNA